MTTSNALGLNWSFGFNRDNYSNIHNISSTYGQKILLYGASNTVIMYDYGNRKQKILQGHTNSITAISVSKQNRWFASADTGNNSMIVVWENSGAKLDSLGQKPETEGLLNAFPIKNIFDPHDGFGVMSIAFTPDSKYLITLGNEPKQKICIWDWTKVGQEKDKPVLSLEIVGERQNGLKVNQQDGLEIMTIGLGAIYFFSYDKGVSEIKQHIPAISAKDFKFLPSGYSAGAFSPNAGQAIIGTKDGDVILFSNKSLSNMTATLERGNKCAIKFIRLHQAAVTFIDNALGKYIITGGEDGIIKLFDLNLRILFWFDKLASGPILSVLYSPHSDTLFEDSSIPELLVATKQAKVYLLSRSNSATIPFRPKTYVQSNEDTYVTSSKYHTNTLSAEDEKKSINPEVTLVMQGQYGKITSLVPHPELPIFAVSGDSGLIQVWDYNTKMLVCSRLITEQHHKKDKKADEAQQENPIPVESLCYSKSGKTLAAGFVNGTIKFMDSNDLVDLPQTKQSGLSLHGYKVSNVAITKIAFSLDGSYCAVTDAEHVISILQKQVVKVNLDSGLKRRTSGETVEEDRIKHARQRIEWSFIGRRKTHYKKVIALLFTTRENVPILYSVSKDRHVVEYDLKNSSATDGIAVKSIRRIEQLYYPEAAILYSKMNNSHNEEFIMTFNSAFKFKLYSLETQLCRKTSLGPTFGGLLSSIHMIQHTETKYMAFVSQNIIGFGKLPLDGNPFRFIGFVGHPFEISNLVSTYNGGNILTAGGQDGCVNMWTLNASVLESQIIAGGEKMDPFLNMLDPSGKGVQGDIYREFEDYFYYAQIKTQGEDVSVDRIVGDTVPLSQVPFIIQAMGYYPSNMEIDDMINEIKYSRFSEGETEEVKEVTLNEIIKLYLNHRPETSVSSEDLEIALSHAKRLEPGKGVPLGPVTKVRRNQTIKTEGLVSIMQQFGESMGIQESKKVFNELLFQKDPYYGNLPSQFTTSEFVENILGMNPTEEVDNPPSTKAA